ncbi:AAA ATPase midasin, partial [Coemansia asiatica]
MPIIEHNQNSSDKPETVDTVKRGLEKLDLATKSKGSETAALAQQQQSESQAPDVVCRSMEQSIEILDIDPLSIDLPMAVKYLESQIALRKIATPESAKPALQKLNKWASQSKPKSDKLTVAKALNRLSALLLAEGVDMALHSFPGHNKERGGALWTDGRFTSLVAMVFRPIVVELVARWTQAEAPASVIHQLGSHIDANRAYLCVAYAAGIIVGTAPQVRSLVMAYFQKRAGPKCIAQLAMEGQGSQAAVSQMLAVALRLLRRMPEAADGVLAWDWQTSLLALMGPGYDSCVRILACECLSLVRGLTDSGRSQVLLQSMASDSASVAELRAWAVYGEQQFDLAADEQMIEQNRVGFKNGLWKQLDQSCNGDKEGQFTWLSDSDLSSCVANVGGVLLHAHDESATETSASGFVLTPTVSANVHEIALATSRREPVLLQGPPGSGKTSLVEWVAQRTGHELVTIHLSSSMDAKVLLGNYVTTQKAGDFEWRAGLLTTAVSEGRWVLIEDIDLAPADVVQTLVPLLESHTLFVASRGEAIRAHIRFRLFATLSTHARSSGSRAGVDGLLGSSIWTRVQIGPLEHEMPLVVAGVFPGLAPHAETLAAAFAQVAGAVAASSGASVGRSSAPVLSTRDLVKWCMRLQAYGANDAFRLFQEAVDAFAMREADYERWRTLIHRIGAVFTIAATRIDNFADQYAPDVSRVGSELRIGRARLPISGPSPDERMPFADTRHSRCLLERIAACVQLGEPVLLSGETGTGKTTVVQHLAALAGRSLAVFNLSQQSDSSDLLGGFRPVDIALVALQLREAFDLLFARTVSVRKNAAFLDSVRVAHARRDWRRLAGLFAAAVKMAQQVISKAKAETEKKTLAETIGSRKRARLTAETIGELDTEWKRFAERVESFDGLRGARMVFSFVEGALVTAARSGGWILLDEVNLAAAETLACLGGLLQAERTIVLAETGERIRCHPDFRLFACMNPANDVGKRDLPPGLRSSFAEFFVHPPDANADDLLAIIRAHLPANTPPAVCHRVIAFYRAAKRLAAEHQLVDGANQRPHYSLRTLTRSLTYARENAAAYSLKRALYDGLCMTFATQLAGTTQPVLLDELARVFEGDSLRQMLAHVPPMRNQDAVLVQGFWLPSLDSEVQAADSAYVMTASVEAKLRALSRAVMCGRYPVLIQGPTSAGKTSMVQHLARLTGHKFVRINNHEHTDLQEYLGAYASVDGRLVFQEGLLVRALREGHWLVLDELNLAPSDVLEALNRLLDDNRELVIPETQEIVRPHPHFMLFATQNPAGLYGGRKALSRAFRNRFVELHFDDIPERELQQIIVDSCQVPPSHAALLVGVYRGLTQTRAQTRIFEASHGFITLRDLFRWANRRATSKIELAEHGFMLLAERVRSEEEKAVVQRAIERVFFPSSTGAGSVRRANTIDIEALYSESRLQAMPEYQAFVRLNQKLATSVAWTSAMRRLFVLTALCLRFHEPVLLVGETGCGKTTVCQMLAQSLGRRLHIVNCHQNTESSDILGGQRPVRNRNALIAAARERLTNAGVKNAESIDSPDALDKITTHSTDDEMGLIGEARELLVRAQSLFAWHDGPLVQAMRQGDVFLMDELNLADDSVLERLNSVLEPSRTLVLAEQAGATTLAAHAGFEFVATMNPGGDYGKRELSPALRNRFTELWAPTTTDVDDLKMILVQRMHSVPEHVECARVILDFVAYLRDGIRVLLHPLSLRDYLFWADFIVRTRPLMDAGSCVVHGACLVLLDAIGTQGSLFNVSVRAPTAVKSECVARLCSMVGWDIASGGNASLRALGVVPARKLLDSGLASSLDIADLAALIVSRDHAVGVAPFFVCEGSLASTSDDLRNRISGFALDAPTTFDNLVKILRAMQVGKPLLLEGSPGVGKTTLVSTLARLAGHRLVRINLSDQTDLMDLFGSDLPVDGGFAWCDAPFLQALKQGDWVLLDEINLASQSVLEGLNSCLDHRGSVYISELDREFTLSPGFRLFAAQNPLGQGGGRKGLPRSFVNRFTQVYMDELARADLQVICDRMYAAHPSIADVLEFNWRMHSETMGRRSFGASGSPWEFNLRDVSRFMELALGASALDARAKPVADFVEMLYVHRMRTETDRKHVADLFLSVFNRPLSPSVPTLLMTEATLQVGGAVLERHQTNAQTSRLRILHSQLTYLESLMRCIEMRWMAILVGPAGCGKTSLVRWLASATGNQLVEFSMNAGVDTSEILGGFEQVDLQRHCTRLVRLLACVNEQALLCASFQDPQQVSAAKQMAELYHQAASATAMSSVSRLCTLAEEMAQLASCFAALSDLSAQILQQTQALAKLEVAGKFEWVDGVLVEALVNGHWLLIDRANLCSASVLDRLNGLLEPNGVLYVNEDPKRTQAIVPHPNFRIIMAVDPQYGELSRAMRNRGIEICVLPSGDSECLVGDQRAVARAIGVGAGLLSGPILPELTVTALVQQAMYVAERVQRGYVASNESGDKDSMLLVRAPGSPSEAAVSVAAWQAALLKMAASMASSSKLAATRMILAILATIPPSTTALSTA